MDRRNKKLNEKPEENDSIQELDEGGRFKWQGMEEQKESLHSANLSNQKRGTQGVEDQPRDGLES